MQSTGYDGDVQNGKYFLLSTRNFAKFVMAHALTFHRTYGICLYAYILQALSVRRYLHGNFERAAQRVPGSTLQTLHKALDTYRK